MINIHIQYDDREKLPWLLWVGFLLWGKYRSRREALLGKSRLLKFLDEEHKIEGRRDE